MYLACRGIKKDGLKMNELSEEKAKLYRAHLGTIRQPLTEIGRRLNKLANSFGGSDEFYFVSTDLVETKLRAILAKRITGNSVPILALAVCGKCKTRALYDEFFCVGCGERLEFPKIVDFA